MTPDQKHAMEDEVHARWRREKQARIDRLNEELQVAHSPENRRRLERLLEQESYWGD